MRRWREEIDYEIMLQMMEEEEEERRKRKKREEEEDGVPSAAYWRIITRSSVNREEAKVSKGRLILLILFILSLLWLMLAFFLTVPHV